jgi:hypothetical protein
VSLTLFPTPAGAKWLQTKDTNKDTAIAGFLMPNKFANDEY